MQDDIRQLRLGRRPPLLILRDIHLQQASHRLIGHAPRPSLNNHLINPTRQLRDGYKNSASPYQLDLPPDIASGPSPNFYGCLSVKLGTLLDVGFVPGSLRLERIIDGKTGMGVTFLGIEFRGEGTVL